MRLLLLSHSIGVDLISLIHVDAVVDSRCLILVIASCCCVVRGSGICGLRIGPSNLSEVYYVALLWRYLGIYSDLHESEICLII
jgi:hypothetical protein